MATTTSRPGATLKVSLALLIVCIQGGGMPVWAGDWPQWRGPLGNSVSLETNLPLAWGEKHNLVWKKSLPGKGASTPAIWRGSIFVTSQDDERLLLHKVEQSTGKIEWTRLVGTGQPRRMPLRAKLGEERREQKFHALHNMASPSPVTDGKVVVVHFGNGDLAAYDFAGEQLWHRNLQQDHGSYTIWWGHANSPVLFEELVINACMQDSIADLVDTPIDSYLVAHDKRTGQLKWKTLRKTNARSEECDSYTTPLLRMVSGRSELVVVGADDVDAYDPATGKRYWSYSGLAKGRTITGPTVIDDLVFATQGMRGKVVALRPDGRGKLGKDAVAWQELKSTPDSSSLVVWQNLLFWITDNGIAHCRDARTGRPFWEQRLAGDYKATPLIAEGRVYFLNLRGRCTVVAAAREFKKLAENQLETETIASPAVSDGRLFFRGRDTLYCIGSP